MQPIAEWLDKLGLGHYTQHFAENGIDLSDLRHLTDQDLKDIGVLLGHRQSLGSMTARAGECTFGVRYRSAVHRHEGARPSARRVGVVC